ncbi:MAG: acetyl-CoA carboxylase biotin carboxylase subunit [Nitrospirota bacterium]
MFKKILIANRGEIAIRIIRTCRELGVKTVAVYSEADRESLHVRFADEAYCVGPPPSTESYLVIPAILEVCRKSGAEAVHPGYGFLSENANFAQCCIDAGLTFIGPGIEAINKMGNKSISRSTMIEKNVPVIPGTEEPIPDDADIVSICKDIGFPVMLKAAAGGGGKGMRIVNSEQEVEDALRAVKREAFAAFANDDILVERYFEESRHIEIQIMADTHGNYVHLFERECSLQRRYQKVIEECPSPVMDEELRSRMTAAAIQAAKSVNYAGAGTVEFLVDNKCNFYFLEMNTRIQVEHSVTEMVTGVDMVKEQLLVAAGEPLSISQDDLKLNGAAVECRIYAEDPENNFLPAPGHIKELILPKGPYVRVDSCVYSRGDVSMHYDPMIAKIVTWGKNRDEARLRMIRALDETIIFGIKSNVLFHKMLLTNESFISGDINTKFIDGLGEFKPTVEKEKHDIAIIAAICSRIQASGTGKLSEEARETDQRAAWRMASKYQYWATRF